MAQHTETNGYKVATFLLVGLLILAGIVFGIYSYANSKYNQGVAQGQQQVINQVLSAAQQGSLTIPVGNNTTLSLVNPNLVVSEIVNSIQKNGYITFNLQKGNMTVVDSSAIVYAQQQTILKIMDEVSKNGQVSLYNNQSKVTLVVAK